MRVLDFKNCAECPCCRKDEYFNSTTSFRCTDYYCKALARNVKLDMSECPFPEQEEVARERTGGMPPIVCPKCKHGAVQYENYCPNCGVKLK